MSLCLFGSVPFDFETKLLMCKKLAILAHPEHDRDEGVVSHQLSHVAKMLLAPLPITS